MLVFLTALSADVGFRGRPQLNGQTARKSAVCLRDFLGNVFYQIRVGICILNHIYFSIDLLGN